VVFEPGLVGLGESAKAGQEGRTGVLGRSEDPHEVAKAGRSEGRNASRGEGRSAGSESWDQGRTGWLSGRPGSWVAPGLPAAESGGGKRRRVLLLGGGVGVLLAVVLVFRVLAGGHGPAKRADSGAIGGLSSVAPPDALSPAPSLSGGGAASSAVGSAGSGRPVLGVTGPTASIDVSAAPSVAPAEGSPRPSGEPSALAPSGPVGTRLTSEGGTVYAVCSQGKGQLTSWDANPGYTVQKVNQGPAFAPEIVFKGAANRYRMTVTCVAGNPTPLVLPL
jgi:serine/threonine-protein kinase